MSDQHEVPQANDNEDEKKTAEVGHRSRPDVAAKRLRRLVEQEAVVKAALRKHLRCGNTKNCLLAAIQARVNAYSKRMHIASTVLSGIVKQCFQTEADVVSARLPDFSSQAFFRQLLLGPSGAVQPDAYVKDYYDAHPDLHAKLCSCPRHLGDRNIYSAGAMLYMTNFRNSFVTNFRSRLDRGLHAFQAAHRLSDDQRVWMLYAVHGWDPTGLRPVVRTQEMAAAVAEQRRVLGLVGPDATVTPHWLGLAQTLPRLVCHAVLVCRYLEHADAKVFNLVPIARRGAHFVTIDTSTLYGLMKELQLVATTCDYDTFYALRDEQWRSLIKVDALLCRNGRRVFTGTIQTDGVSVCMHFRMPKVETPEPRVGKASVLAKGLTVLGMDPGRSNIYCFAMQKDDGKTKTWKLRRSQYYSASGILAARKQTKTWERNVQAELAALSQVSTKGTSVAAHEQFLACNMAAFDALFGEYMKPRWARQRLRLYGGKRRAITRFLNRVAEEAKADGGGKPVVIAYGASKFAPGAKGEVSVPTTKAYRCCAERFETVLVDEFRTTQMDARTGDRLQAVARRSTGAVVRGLLWYASGSITATSRFVDRDLNAALNIRRCAVLPRRPRELCRIKGQAPLGRNRVGKTIRR